LDVPPLPLVSHISPSVTPPPKYEESLPPHHSNPVRITNRTTPSGMRERERRDRGRERGEIPTSSLLLA
jgi:hypothetical protein